VQHVYAELNRRLVLVGDGEKVIGHSSAGYGLGMRVQGD